MAWEQMQSVAILGLLKLNKPPGEMISPLPHSTQVVLYYSHRYVKHRVAATSFVQEYESLFKDKVTHVLSFNYLYISFMRCH